MEKTELLAALKETPDVIIEAPEIVEAILPKIFELDKAKEIINNKAESIYQAKITNEVSKIHSQYDVDMETILGEKPGQLEDGTKQKTYDKIKGLYGELKTLREQKDSLSKDAAVAELKTQIEDLKKNGPGAHWEKTFNTEKQKWTEEKNGLMKRLNETQESMTTFKKKSDIETGLRGLKFRDDIPESARRALIDMQVSKMIQNSKVEDGKIIYLDDSGAQINDAEYKPQSSNGILMNALKDIIATENNKKGGGANTVVSGSIETTTIDGKNVQKLQLNPTQFKTKTEFVNHAEEAMLKSGLSRGGTNWDALKNEAYNRYGVANLPR